MISSNTGEQSLQQKEEPMDFVLQVEKRGLRSDVLRRRLEPIRIIITQEWHRTLNETKLSGSPGDLSTTPSIIIVCFEHVSMVYGPIEMI